MIEGVGFWMTIETNVARGTKRDINYLNIILLQNYGTIWFLEKGFKRR